MLNNKYARIISKPVAVAVTIIFILFFSFPQLHNPSFIIWSVFISIVFIWLLKNNRITLQSPKFLVDFYSTRIFPKNEKTKAHLNHQEDFRVRIGSSGCALPQNVYIFDLGGTHLSTVFYNSDEQHTNAGTMESFDLLNGTSILKIRPGTYHSISPASLGLNNFKTEAARSQFIELDLSAGDENYNSHCLNGTNPPPPQSIASLGYSQFTDAKSMVIFLEHLQQLSGGRPAGIRISTGFKKELYAICHAICKTGIIPDFISIGSSSCNEIQLDQSLLFLSQTLQHYGLTGKIRIIVYVNISTGFEVLKFLSLGADAIIHPIHSYDNPMLNKDLATVDPPVNTSQLLQLRASVLQMIGQLMREHHLKSYKDITIPFLFRLLGQAYAKRKNIETNFCYPLFN